MLAQHAITSTVLLVVLALTSRMLVLEPISPDALKAQELLRQCLHWRDLAMQDTDAVLRLQHATTAHAYLQSARYVSTDVHLERSSGMDIQRLAHSVEDMLGDARALLQGSRVNNDCLSNSTS